MADKKTDNTLEGLSDKTLINITIGLFVLLIIAGGAYFFFMSSDEPSSEDATIGSNEGVIAPELTPSTLTAESAETEGGAPNTETPPLTKEYTAA